MALSRTALTLGLILSPAPLVAQIVAVEEADVLGAIARQRALQPEASWLLVPECLSSNPDEIVICAPERRPALRVPNRREAGSPPRRALGEVAAASPSLQECHRLCHDPVGVTINVGRLLSDPGGALKEMLRGRR